MTCRSPSSLRFVTVIAKMNTHHETGHVGEKHTTGAAYPQAESPTFGEKNHHDGQYSDPEIQVGHTQQNALHQDLRGRHMQMIAM